MQPSRLSLAVENGLFAPPAEGRIAVFRPRAGMGLDALAPEQVEVVQGFRPDHDAFAARGYAVAVAPTGPYAAAIVCVPRSKVEARALVAQAAAGVAAGAPIAVDGLKTDGVDGLLREIRARVPVSEALAKAHGKFAVFPNPGPKAFDEWQPREAPRTAEGHLTHASAFSADGIDPGSAALAAILPLRMPPKVADLGAGWGFLALQVLAREGVAEVHLIEAEHAALEAARANIADPRARFHWADATAFRPEQRFDAVVTNPPFHRGRTADPGLGRAFIAAAARMLTPSGTLWMVSNRHLPYERTLAELFRDVVELPGPAAFKLHRATGARQPQKSRN